MIKDFGENLRNLRKKIDLTQDEIARMLNVSTQTISRWETNMGYPDIEMLPAIANLYGVSVDYLLGVDVNRKNEKLNKIINQINTHKNKGELKQCIELCNNALKEFPNNFQIMQGLVSCLYNYGESEDEIKKNNKQVIELSETILRECKDDSIRHYATQMLCLTYPMFNMTEKAIDLASKMPSYFSTSNELVARILNGDDKKQCIQENFTSILQLISINIEEIFFLSNSFEEKIKLLKSLLNIYKGFFDEEDYNFFHSRIHRIYRYMAAVYADNQKYDETLECIEKTSEHAILFDTMSDEHIYKSTIFKGLKGSTKDFSKKSTNNYSWVLLDKLNDERYDFVRKDEKFTKIINKLEEIAKE